MYASPIFAVAFSEKECIMAAGCSINISLGFEDKNIRILDGATDEELFELKGHSHVIHQLVFSPDGKVLASCIMFFYL